MFSSQVNSRDLFLSNPIDHFLGQEPDLRPSFESGFSSSYNYSRSGNSKEIPYPRNSEDLFTCSEKTDASNGDYQKYISQNLLLGKTQSSPRNMKNSRITEKDDDVIYKERLASASTAGLHDESKLNEIRNLVETVNDTVRKLGMDAGCNKSLINMMKEQVSDLNSKITSIEKVLEKQADAFNKQGMCLKDHDKKHEDSVNLLCNIISKNAEKISLMEDIMKCDRDKILKATEKFLKAQEKANKKSFQELKLQNEYVLRDLQRMEKIIQKDFRVCLEDLKTSFDLIVGERINSLETMLNNYITTRKRDVSHDTNAILQMKKYVPRFQQNPVERNVFDSSSNYLQDNYRYTSVPIEAQSKTTLHARNFGLQKFASNEYEVHTPIANILSNLQKSPLFKRIPKKAVKEPEMSPYKAKLRNSTKYAKVQRRIMSPALTKRIKKKDLLPSPFSENTAESKMLRNKNIFTVRKNYSFYNEKETDRPEAVSATSSPCLTVYQAVTLANEYAFSRK